jgi:hypothetical protein
LLGLLSVLVVPLLKIIEGEVNIVGDRMFVLAIVAAADAAGEEF